MPDVLPENHRAAGALVGRPEIHPHRHEGVGEKIFPADQRGRHHFAGKKISRCGHCHRHRHLGGGGRGLCFFQPAAFRRKPPKPAPITVSTSASDWLAGQMSAMSAAAAHVSRAGGVFTISGSGADIWHTGRWFLLCFSAAERRRLAHGRNPEFARTPTNGPRAV